MNAIVFRRAAFEQVNQIVQTDPARVPEFAAAFQQMIDTLPADAGTVGESRDPPYRVAFFGDLTVHYRLAPEEGRVYVVRLRLRKRRPG